MEFDCELNFTEICRCCKRTSFGMTSIFDGSTHPTYPPVKDMLKCIASLKMQEDDGLPSLVCISCIDNIQDAYTFIVHLILIDEELQQTLLARRKQTETLSQATNDSTKKENESEPVHVGAQVIEIHDSDSDDVQHLLKVEDFDEPMQNDYQHGSVEEGNELLSQKELSKSVHSQQSLTEITTIEDIQWNHQIHYSEAYEDITDSNSEQDLDAAEIVVIDEPTQGMMKCPPQTLISNMADTLRVFKCKLCGYTCTRISRLKPHLTTHTKCKAFMCSKCNGTFTESSNLKRHELICNGKISNNIRNKWGKRSKKIIPLTLKDLADPLERKKYYTVSERSVSMPRYECNMCAYTTSRMRYISRHYRKHSQVSFTCAKCNESFAKREWMLRHWQSCNGELKKGNASKQVTLLMMTPQNIESDIDATRRTEKSTKESEDVDYDDDNEDGKSVDSLDSDYTPYRKGKNQCAGRTPGRPPKVIETILPRTAISKTGENIVESHFLTAADDSIHSPTHLDSAEGINEAEADGKGAEMFDEPKVKDEIYPKLQGKLISNLSPAVVVLHCKLCGYTTKVMNNFKVHLQSHFKVKPFACPKCNGTFTQQSSMLTHVRKCNGVRYAHYKEREGKKVISMTLQDLKDPEIVKNYYTVSEIGAEHHHQL